MSRLDEALRRAGKTAATPESFNVPSARALDWFSPVGETRQDAGGSEKPAVPTKPPVVESPDIFRVPEPPELTRAATLQVFEPAKPANGSADPEPAVAKVSIAVPNGYQEKLVIGDGMRSVAVEQYRRLAAVLHHAQRERGIKVVMIASALPSEGKTLTSVNLAFTLGESYRRQVLLVDADLRRPMIHEALGFRNVRGLNEALTAPADGKIAITPISPHLSVLLAGRANPDPMSSLTSERMKRVVAEAAERYDWVILDTPPLALLPDTNLLAAMVDAAVLVVCAGRSPFAVIQKAADAVGRDRILGVVLNQVADREVIPDYAGGGYYSYAPKTEEHASA